MNKVKHKNNYGFSLIEVVVATGIFGLIISIVFGIYILAAAAQRQIIAVKNVEDNIRFAMESMAREIRTGSSFGGGGNTLSFVNAKGESVVYRLNNNTAEKSSDNGINFDALTGPEATVNYLNFYLLGAAPGDGVQPRVTTTIGITSIVGNRSANLKIQTSITSRILQP